MAKMRSPNYPAVGLPDALTEARKIWDKEKKTAVSIDVLAGAMGYSSVSGNVRTKVASLRKYGLLEQSGGKLRVSDIAMKALLGQPDEQAQALAIAAQRPELFKEMLTSHPDASDAAIRSELVLRRGFSEAGARQFIKAFRETMSIADPSKAGYSGAMDAEVPEAMSGIGTQGQTKTESHNATSQANAWTWTLSIPRNVRAELKIAGDVTRDDVRRLKQQIEFLEESFEEEQ
jgi:hypothetical protein